MRGVTLLFAAVLGMVFVVSCGGDSQDGPTATSSAAETAEPTGRSDAATEALESFREQTAPVCPPESFDESALVIAQESSQSVVLPGGVDFEVADFEVFAEEIARAYRRLCDADFVGYCEAYRDAIASRITDLLDAGVADRYSGGFLDACISVWEDAFPGPSE